MRTWTYRLLTVTAALAISSCPAWGDVNNGDFTNGLSGWNAFTQPADPSLALVEFQDADADGDGELHLRVTNNYVYDGGWQLQEPVLSTAYVMQNIFANDGIPAGTTALQFSANVQILDNPTNNTGAVVAVNVNYGGYFGDTYYGDLAQGWTTTSSTNGPETVSIGLPGLDEDYPLLDMYLYAYPGLNTMPDPISGTSYSITVDAVFDDFELVTDGNEEPPTTVQVDIKPGVYPNAINLGSNGGVPVAICSTDTFDAADVDPLTVTLADAGLRVRGKGKSIYSMEDVNGDGLLDMILNIDTQALELTADATEALLKGMTYDGLVFEGIDAVKIVPETVATDVSGLAVAPEPSSLVLLILGGVGVLRRRQLRNSRK